MEKIDSQPGRPAGKTLSPDNLARDFGVRAELARHGVRALYEAILAAEHPTIPATLQRWKSLVARACGYDLRRPSAALEKLAACYGTAAAGLKPDAMLFALHTYYALLLKLVVGQVMAHSRGLVSPVERILQADSRGCLRDEMAEIAAAGVSAELNVVDPFRGDPFSWFTVGWSAPVARFTGRLAATLAEYDPGTLCQGPGGGGDLLGHLYQELFPRALRHKLGEYYTPDWLADHVLDRAGYTGDADRRLLDPACGSGTFLVRAIGRVRAACRPGGDPGLLCRKLLANVVGFDLNPLAVMAARANYLIAIRDLLEQAGRVRIPVHLCDSILDGPPSVGRFDYVVGNPPWIAWDNLPDDYRRATKPLWERYGLFSLSGKEARHGGGKKDLSMLMMYAGADRYLKDGGRLAMVITQTLFQTKGAGDGFRRFRLGPDGDPLKVLRVDDMVALRPFQDAANWTSTIVVEKGAETQYPVPYVRWLPGGGEADLPQRTCQAEPIDPARPGSPWFLRPEGLTTALDRLVGPSDYVARLGANSGGANGVYWLRVLGETSDGVLVRNVPEKGKSTIELVEQVIEPDLLYPLIRWADVTRYRALPSAHVLLAQDVETRSGIDEARMRREYPRTYAYLQRFQGVLVRRAAYKRYQGRKPFYSMYNVGPYTLAPIKVVWRRMDRRINAAVVQEADDPVLGPRPVIPQETCVLIACRRAAEAHYLCALLNSSIVNFLVTAHSVRGGKGFGTPSLLDFVKLRGFDPDDPRHQELAACSRQAHEAAATGDGGERIQQRMDRLAGELWGLGAEELDAIDAGR